MKKLSSYEERCGGCARYNFCIINGQVRAIGTCQTTKKGTRTNLASTKKCNEYIDKRRKEMTKAELNALVDHLIVIRDIYDLSRESRDILADACNVIYDNIDILADDNNHSEILKIRSKVTKLFEGCYLVDDIDDWTEGEHFAYQKVIDIIDDQIKGG